MSDNDQPRTSGYNALYLMLGNMQGDIKAVLEAFKRIEDRSVKRDEEVDHRLNAHADRLTDLEKFRWKLAGLAMMWPTVLVIGGWLAAKYL